METATTYLHPEWKILYERYRETEYGSFVDHQTIEEIIGISRSDKPSVYYAMVNKWKREMLRSASRHIECVNTKGYEIVMPDRFRVGAKRQMKLGKKRMKKAGEIVLRVPIDMLTDEEKNKVGEMATLITQVLHFTKVTMRKVNEIDKKTDKLMIDVGKALDVAD